MARNPRHPEQWSLVQETRAAELEERLEQVVSGLYRETQSDIHRLLSSSPSTALRQEMIRFLEGDQQRLRDLLANFESEYRIKFRLYQQAKEDYEDALELESILPSEDTDRPEETARTPGSKKDFRDRLIERYETSDNYSRRSGLDELRKTVFYSARRLLLHCQDERFRGEDHQREVIVPEDFDDPILGEIEERAAEAYGTTRSVIHARIDHCSERLSAHREQLQHPDPEQDHLLFREMLQFLKNRSAATNILARSEALQMKVQGLERSVALKQTLEDRARALDETARELDKQERGLTLRQQQVESLTQESLRAISEAEDRQRELDRRAAALETTRQQLDQDREAFDQRRQQFDIQQSALRQQKWELQRREQALTRLKGDLAEAHRRLELAERDQESIQDLRALIRAFQRLFSQAESEIADIAAIADEVETLRSQLRSERQQYREQLNSLTQAYQTDLKESADEAEEVKTELERHLHELKEQLEVLKPQHQTDRERVSELETELEAQTESLLQVEFQRETLQAVSDDQQESLQRLTGEIQRARAGEQQLQQALENLQNEHARLMQRFEQFHQNASIREEVSQRQNAALQADHERDQRIIASLQKDIDQTRMELQQAQRPQQSTRERELEELVKKLTKQRDQLHQQLQQAPATVEHGAQTIPVEIIPQTQPTEAAPSREMVSASVLIGEVLMVAEVFDLKGRTIMHLLSQILPETFIQQMAVYSRRMTHQQEFQSQNQLLSGDRCTVKHYQRLMKQLSDQDVPLRQSVPLMTLKVLAQAIQSETIRRYEQQSTMERISGRPIGEIDCLPQLDRLLRSKLGNRVFDQLLENHLISGNDRHGTAYQQVLRGLQRGKNVPFLLKRLLRDKKRLPEGLEHFFNDRMHLHQRGQRAQLDKLDESLILA